MKKTFLSILAAILVLSLCACSESGSGKTGGDSGVLRAGLVQMADNGAFTDMREGFIARMEELGYGNDKLVIDYKNAQGDMTALNSICQDMADSGVAFVATIGTPASQAMVNLDSGIPVFFISVSDPLAAGIISDLSSPDNNATGTSNAIPIDEIFRLADNLTPGIKSYGIIYNTGEVNAVKTAKEAVDYLESIGLSSKEAIVTASSEVQQAAQSLVGAVDAIFVPNDSMVQSAMPQVAEVAKEAGIPLYGSSAVMVASGAFATISIDDYTIGAMTADMAAAYLGGKPVTEIPAVVVSEFTTVINQTTVEALGVSLPQDVLDSAVIID